MHKSIQQYIGQTLTFDAKTRTFTIKNIHDFDKRLNDESDTIDVKTLIVNSPYCPYCIKAKPNLITTRHYAIDDFVNTLTTFNQRIIKELVIQCLVEQKPFVKPTIATDPWALYLKLLAVDRAIVRFSFDTINLDKVVGAELNTNLIRALYDIETLRTRIRGSFLSWKFADCQRLPNGRYLPKLVIDTQNALADKDDLFIYTGNAGTGKTTAVCRIVKKYKHILFVSLSDIVGIGFMNKLSKEVGADTANEICTLRSFTGVRHLGAKALDKGTNQYVDADCIVIDEMSLIGADNTPELVKLLRANVPIYMMGDIDQIPNFISNGSYLWNSLNVNRAKHIVHMTKNYRQENNPALFAMCQAALQGDLSQLATTTLDKLMVRLTTKDIKLLTITHRSVQKLNWIVMALRNASFANYYTLEDLKADIDANDLYHIKQKMKYYIVSNQVVGITVQCERKTPQYLRKTEWVTTSFDDTSVTLTSSKKRITVDKNAFIRDFEVGYASTIASIQGLEWEHTAVVLFERDCCISRENMYVALSRAKSNTCVISNVDLTKKLTCATFGI